MSRNIIFSRGFRKSIKSINNENYYIKKNFQELVLEKVENLIYFPKMYPKLENRKYRKIPILNYIIIYRIEKNTIKILDIIPTKTKKSNEIHKLQFKIF